MISDGSTNAANAENKLTFDGTNLTITGGLITNDDTNSKVVIGRYSSGNKASYIKLGSNSTSLRITNAADNVDLLELTDSGGLGIGVNGSTTAGRIDAANDIVAFSSSDKRWKTNIKPIENSIEKIKQISGNSFDWIEDSTYHGNKGTDIGVIAQEIEEILPEIVQTRDSGMKAVKYEKIIPLLIEAIKDQQKQIEDQQKQIDELKTKLK